MASLTRLAQRVLTRVGAGALVLASLMGTATPDAQAATAACQLPGLGGAVQHVIEIQFDNTHYTRDNPNVPSDLEQMPNLLNFMTSNGTLLTDQHTPLIAHTADDILTTMTGVYGDRHGQPVANSYYYFNPNGTSQEAGSFAYWTDPVDQYGSSPTDFKPNMIDQQGTNAPAPWVPFTRAGCNVGSVATANTELENTTPDVAEVFGANSPQAQEATSNPTQATSDFLGISVHCAAGATLCSSANGGVADLLPAEPGGYTGFNGLFGDKYVAPQIATNGVLDDLNGTPITGFPGYDAMVPAVSLAYVASMQEHGVPITYAYISDAHDNHATGEAYGPGQAGYVAQLASFNTAFGEFFARLAADGINASNTLFVITSDEGDHFVGGPPNPVQCNGVTIPCYYHTLGEIDVNSTGLLLAQDGITTGYNVHSDSAPVFYLNGNPTSTSATTRAFERAMGSLTVTNLITNATEPLANYQADPVEMSLLYMITADPARTATFTTFAKPDYYVTTDGPNCTANKCENEPRSYAWNHGDVSPDINTTWLGLVGPGVQNLGVDNNVWSDHTDVRPTMLTLLGLTDDYSHQGRALVEALTPAAIPAALSANLTVAEKLMAVYKQINAPVGELGLATLAASTTALDSGSATDDSTYTSIEGQISQITKSRNALDQQIESAVEGATFRGQPLNVTQANTLIAKANVLIEQGNILAGSPASPAK